MLSTVFQGLIGTRYPRRYVGRHRARLAIRIVVRHVSARPPSPRPANDLGLTVEAAELEPEELAAAAATR